MIIKNIYTFNPFHDEETKEKIRADITRLFNEPHLEDFIFIVDDETFTLAAEKDAFNKYLFSPFFGNDLLMSVISRMEFWQQICIPS